MAMNLKRGLFRLWLIISVPWALGFGTISVTNGRTFFLERAAIIAQEKKDCAGIPELTEKENPSVPGFHEVRPCEVIVVPPTPKPGEKIENWTIQQLLYAKYSERWRNRDRAKSDAVGFFAIAAVPPIVLLIFGWALLWAFSGFKAGSSCDGKDD